jgi:5-methyltetrahydrofolate--homocysteine methyltransferase
MRPRLSRSAPTPAASLPFNPVILSTFPHFAFPLHLFFSRLLRERIVILDGAMGTMIQSYRLDEAGYRGEHFKLWPRDLKGNNDLLSLTQPHVVQAIHRQYLEAGADIIETNTFNSTSISLADYGMESLVPELNLAGARTPAPPPDAVMAAQPGRICFVAGAIGPTTKSASIVTDVNNPAARSVTFDPLAAAYYEQARALMDGGVDVLLLIETVFDSLNSKAALFAIAKLFDDAGRRVPVMLSFTITDLSGRTLSGQTVEAYWNSVSHFPLLEHRHQLRARPQGNAALHQRELVRPRPHFRQRLSQRRFAQSALPTGFPETPESLAPQLAEWAQAGWLNIVGGCCGTTPRTSRPWPAVRGLPPRVPPPRSSRHPPERPGAPDHSPRRQFRQHRRAHQRHRLAPLRQAHPRRQFEEALAIARSRSKTARRSLMSTWTRPCSTEKAMTHFLNLVGPEDDIARVPIMIDSSKWPVIEAGLKCIQGKAIVNSISLKEGEENSSARRSWPAATARPWW